MDSQNKTILKYTITVTVEDLSKGEFVKFNQLVQKECDFILDFVPVQIDKRDVTLYIEEQINRYCIDNDITAEELFVDGYEIEHTNEGIDIYFSVEDMEKFSLEPSVMAVRSNIKNKPLLEAEQLDENTIRWQWDWNGVSEYTSTLYTFEADKKVVAHTPINVNYFIESNVESNSIVTRTVVVTKGETSMESIPISMSVTDNSNSSIFRRYEAPKRNDEYRLQNMQVASRLKAFKSGVGDNDDCKIYKPDETKYAKKFKLINKIYGVRASSTIKYNTVKFFYRYMIKGKVHYKGYDGSFKIRGRAIRIPDIEEEPTDIEYSSIESRDYCEYSFSDEAFVAEIYMYDLFHGLPEIYKGGRYKFVLEMYDVNGRMEVYSPILGCNQVVDVENGKCSFEFKGYYNERICVKSLPKLKEKDYIEIYPPKQYEPLVGAVNGDFEVTIDGKKNMVSFAPEFDAPSVVFDKKYYCLIENDKTNPSVADVQFKFEHQESGEDFTYINGDKCVFKCESIIEDVTEYREFITQIDKGYYSISDNRKHNYRYRLDLSNLDNERYKRFEVDVTTNVNDIVVLSQDVDVNKLDKGVGAELYVSVRALQSAIARWNPYIHSGYYYYNQEERFLYNKSNIDGKNVKPDQFCYTGDISVNIILHVQGGDGEKEEYNFELNTRDDLDLSPSKFDYIDGLLWPRPLHVVDDFPEYAEEYVFYTKPFVCRKEPTKILKIDWTEITSKYTSVDVYAVTFNDVYGEWREPILVEKGKPLPKEIKPSKVMMLKFVLRPSRRPQIKVREYNYACEEAWRRWTNNNLSYNIICQEEVLEQKSKRTNGYMISNLHDLGDTVEEKKERSIKVSIPPVDGQYVRVFYQDGNDYSKMNNSMIVSEWIKMDYNKEYIVDRYVRFKVEVRDKGSLRYLHVVLKRYEYTDMKKEDYLPAFGDIKAKEEYNPDDFIKLVEYTASMPLPFDKHKHILVENMMVLGNNLGRDQSFSSRDIIKVDFQPIGMYSDEYEIIYERADSEPIMTNKPLLIQSNDHKEDIELKENNQAGVIVKPYMGKTIEVSPIPQQFSPIIIQEEFDNGTKIVPYTQVYFTDELGYYTLTNVEEFESLGFSNLYLKHHGIDLDSVTVRIDGQIVSNYQIKDNLLIFDKKVDYGRIVSIHYRLKNSFIASYDYENNKVIIDLHGEDLYHLCENIRIHYETHETSALRKLNHISLNPIYNPLYNGYIYISDKIMTPFKVSIVASDNMIYANGLDTMSVLVLVEDKYGNPMPGMQVNATAGFGKLNKDREKTDNNGIARFEYTSWTGDCIDVVKAIITDSVYGETSIINRKVIRETKTKK